MDIKIKKEFIYQGVNEENRIMIMRFIIGINSVQLKLSYKDKVFIIPLSTNILDRYKLIEKIKNIIKTKEIQCLNLDRLFTGRLYKNKSVSLMCKNNKYCIEININDSMYCFYISDLNEILSTLKKDTILPGDRFIGLEVINPIKYERQSLIWKTKCLLCGRSKEVPQSHLKRDKSCGCLHGLNFDSDEERFFDRVNKQEGIPKEKQIRGTLGIDEEPCWLYTRAKVGGGYGSIFINNKRHGAHRYSWEIHNNEKLTNPNVFICHRCDNPSCVNPNHLFKGTPLDNVIDRDNKNRRIPLCGERHYKSRLTKDQIIEIRNERLLSTKEMSKKYKVSYSNIYDVINRRSWFHF